MGLTSRTLVRVVLLFIDGVGVGRRDAAVNPLARFPGLLSHFLDEEPPALPAGVRAQRLDATFGLPGRPQSASNQTALYTGLAAPRLIGGHVLGFPDARLRELLATHSLVAALAAAGRRSTFANAFHPAYLAALGLRHEGPPGDPSELPAPLRRRLKASASTLAMAAGGTSFRTSADAAAGRALTHDIDGHAARHRLAPGLHRTPAEAARILWDIAQDFTLFEHFLADEAGHAQDLDRALSTLRTFDEFAREVLALRPPDAQVLICSDHGNVEDCATRSHTRNPVLLLSAGPAVVPHLVTLAEVGGLVKSLLGAA